jgi:hypothetical protein
VRRAPQAVVVGDAAAPPRIERLAAQLGARLAHLGCTVVTGGGGGVMAAVSRGAVRAGGRTVGILPSADAADANPWCQVVVPTGLGHARNAVTALAGDVVIAVGGGAGTLSELAFAWMHGRPILLLAGSGGWAERLAGQALDARRSAVIETCADLDACEASVRRHLGPPRGRGR